MKPLLTRDIPPRAALVVVALALLTTVVAGRESTSAPEAAVPVRTAYAPRAPDLDVAKLIRQRADDAVEDLFALPPPPAPPAPVVTRAEPPPVPAAPPLPFTYLGRMKKGERTTLYLLRNQDMVIVEAGENLENVYRVDNISDTVAQFVYLPLGTVQVLALPPVN